MSPRTNSFKLEWDAHEYEHKERSSDWLWAVWILAVAIALASIIFSNIIFGVLVLVAVFALTVFANRPPENVHVVIDERGIIRGNVRYLYESLESFWIDEDHPHKKIILKSEKPFMPFIIVPLDESVDTDKLHETLSQLLNEEYHELPFLEKVLEFLGF